MQLLPPAEAQLVKVCNNLLNFHQNYKSNNTLELSYLADRNFNLFLILASLKKFV